MIGKKTRGVIWKIYNCYTFRSKGASTCNTELMSKQNLSDQNQWCHRSINVSNIVNFSLSRGHGDVWIGARKSINSEWSWNDIRSIIFIDGSSHDHVPAAGINLDDYGACIRMRQGDFLDNICDEPYNFICMSDALSQGKPLQGKLIQCEFLSVSIRVFSL